MTNKELELKIKEIAHKHAIDYDSYKVIEGLDCNQLYHFARDFGHYVCELQKQRCSEDAEADYTFGECITDVDDRDGQTDIKPYVIKHSILNTPNICS